MSDYDNTNRGTFGRNERKTQDTHPDFTGSINVNGVEYWLNGYEKERKDGSGSFMSLRVKPKEAPKAAASAPIAKPAAKDYGDADFPF
ncbi:hypothetical protein UFOVP73_21 [uncultured Caudovirales phage]|uniref:DUF736 domain-containing protein n=1 Tax=uncultured Caudovirales phage TaxID=2100421 RepID=A0A6J5KYN8_9CAUD|nr:hypothetical protein UFOVP73_21 [uncultured Caudovirales phage]CAB5195053.1 hypothetical protein UFOVP170_43 [uncultured Caudovirales phage]